jgi:hypothetical protein
VSDVLTDVEGDGVSRASTALVAGGVLWVAAAAIGGDDGTGRFYAVEAVWLLAQLALLGGTWLLWRQDPHGGRRWGAVGFALAIAGRATFAAAEAVAIVDGKTQDGLLPVAATLTAVGMVVAGVVVVRAHVWTGWPRVAPLAVGSVPFVVMFPFAASSSDGPPAVSLVVWGASFALLGLAALQSPRGG